MIDASRTALIKSGTRARLPTKGGFDVWCERAKPEKRGYCRKLHLRRTNYHLYAGTKPSLFIRWAGQVRLSARCSAKPNSQRGARSNKKLSRTAHTLVHYYATKFSSTRDALRWEPCFYSVEIATLCFNGKLYTASLLCNIYSFYKTVCLLF